MTACRAGFKPRANRCRAGFESSEVGAVSGVALDECALSASNRSQQQILHLDERSSFSYFCIKFRVVIFLFTLIHSSATRNRVSTRDHLFCRCGVAVQNLETSHERTI